MSKEVLQFKDFNHPALLVSMYRDYMNNFITVIRFSEYHNTSIPVAERVIEAGKKLHNKDNNQLQAERNKRSVKDV